MAVVVGLDIGTSTLKGVVLAGAPRKYRVVDFFEADLHEESPPAASADGEAGGGDEEASGLGARVREILRARKLEGAEVVVALDAKDCGIREFSIPFTREDQIQRTVSFEAEHHFLAFDIDEVILEWIKVGELDGKSQLLLFAVPKEQIEDYLATLRSADVDPIALDLDAAAVANAFALSPYYDPTASALIIDMGSTSTKIVLVQDGKLRKVRSLRTAAAVTAGQRMMAAPAGVSPPALSGGDGDPDEGESIFSGSIETRFQEIEAALKRLEPVASDQFDLGLQDPTEPPIAILSDEDYERVQNAASSSEPTLLDVTPAAPSSDAPETTTEHNLDYGDYLERIAIETHRTFATYQLDAPVDLICLTGGHSRPEARQFFQEEFDVDVVELDFGDALPSDLGHEAAERLGKHGGVALGLAAKGLGHDTSNVDFRKGPYRYERRFEKLRFALLTCSILCFAFFLNMTYWSFHEYRKAKTTVATKKAQSAMAYKNFFSKDLPSGRDPVRAAEEQLKQWKAGGLGDAARFLDFVDVTKNVGEVLNGAGVHFTIESMDFDLRLQRSRAGGGSKRDRGAPKPRWQVSPSRVVLFAEESDAHIKFDKQFRSERSKYFTSTSQSAPDKKSGGYKITLKLDVKPGHLRS